MENNENFENYMLELAERLGEELDGFVITMTKDGIPGFIWHGDDEDTVLSLAHGIVEHEDFRAIVLKAIGLAMHELEYSAPDIDIDAFSMN